MPIARINSHDMYYEVVGDGDPALCMGGWGTFCHGRAGNLARGLTDRYKTLIIDYRGIGESTDDLSLPPSMELHAQDIIELLDHLEWKKVHLIGLVGMGACVSQLVALTRPDLVRSMVNMGCWSWVDDPLKDHLEMFRDVHLKMGFDAFQKFVCYMSFLPEYYKQNRRRLLGEQGPWGELIGRETAHARLVEACLGHDVREVLNRVQAPTLVFHAGKDQVTSPRYTREIEELLPNAEGAMMEDVAHVVAGKTQKIRFCELLFSFLEKH